MLEILIYRGQPIIIKSSKLAQEDKDMDLKELIQGIYDEHHGNYGYRRIHRN
ncbi:IS3 family transposase [Streptococcus equi subsp. equi]|nr:IS3 family transposase [Streptococcus equi subsp. equi]